VNHSGKSTNYTLLHSTQQTKEEHNSTTTESLRADNSRCRVRQVHYYPYEIMSDHPTQVSRPQDLPPDKPSSRPITWELKSQYTHMSDSKYSMQGTEFCLKAISPLILPTHLIVTTRPLNPQIQYVFWSSSPIVTSNPVRLIHTGQETDPTSNNRVQILVAIESKPGNPRNWTLLTLVVPASLPKPQSESSTVFPKPEPLLLVVVW
jgi:hypothetical protein